MLIKSTVFDQTSGSAANITASKNRGGQYFRQRTTPANPQTAAQTTVRATLASVSAAWRSLTEAQRTAWDAAAANFPATNSLGQPIAKTGHQVFVQLNSSLRSVTPAASLIEEPPTPEAFPTVTVASFAPDIDAGSLAHPGTFTPADVPTGYKAQIYCTPLLSAGISAPPNSGYKLVGVIAAGSSFGTWVDLWEAYFGAPAVGQKIFLSITMVNTATGQSKEVLNASAVLRTA